jgi:beta-lactamase superfamily II metal-dependent hydrolase
LDLTPPALDQVEVSVVGRGYGECVLVHLGWGDWLVVDSCIEQREPPAPYAALYLEQIGVPFEAVRWLLASHWHDDHVAGFGALVQLCSSAEVFMSEAMRSEEFISLSFVGAGEPPGRISSGIKEMRRTLTTLRVDNRKVQQARADQRLYVDNVHGVTREIWALSPSNAASLRAKQAFVAESLPTLADRRRVLSPSPNEASVALLIRVGDAVALLGADLEHTKTSDRGWNAVLSSPGRPQDRASLFKLAHHGADNGDHPDVWTQMLEPDVIAALTPYGTGVRPRPDDADVSRICARAADAYIAGPRRVKRPRASSPVEKVRRKAVRSSVIAERPLGQIRCRRSISDDNWDVALHGTAERLGGSRSSSKPSG